MYPQYDTFVIEKKKKLRGIYKHPPYIYREVNARCKATFNNERKVGGKGEEECRRCYRDTFVLKNY